MRTISIIFSILSLLLAAAIIITAIPVGFTLTTATLIVGSFSCALLGWFVARWSKKQNETHKHTDWR